MIAGLHRELRRAYAQAGMLYELHLDLLYQCDLDCEHCYLDDKSRRILPTDFWRDVIDQAADLQVASLLLSGGEIFLRKDLVDLIAQILCQRMRLALRFLKLVLEQVAGFLEVPVVRLVAGIGERRAERSAVLAEHPLIGG